MKHFTTLLLALSFGMLAHAHADQAKFFPDKGTEFGVYYYPEHWSEDQWERDIKNMADLGFTFVHCAEFAWQRMEPADGEFDFTWLDKGKTDRWISPTIHFDNPRPISNLHPTPTSHGAVSPGPSKRS